MRGVSGTKEVNHQSVQLNGVFQVLVEALEPRIEQRVPVALTVASVGVAQIQLTLELGQVLQLQNRATARCRNRDESYRTMRNVPCGTPLDTLKKIKNKNIK
jgi:hypothetical protein